VSSLVTTHSPVLQNLPIDFTISATISKLFSLLPFLPHSLISQIYSSILSILFTHLSFFISIFVHQNEFHLDDVSTMEKGNMQQLQR